MKNKNRENSVRARQEARPKKIMELFGWTIRVDERQYITNSEKEDYRYFSTLENALWHIAEQSEKLNTYADLKDAIKKIKEVKVKFLEELRKVIAK